MSELIQLALFERHLPKEGSPVAGIEVEDIPGLFEFHEPGTGKPPQDSIGLSGVRRGSNLPEEFLNQDRVQGFPWSFRTAGSEVVKEI
jgi:hypothetical protein